MFSLAKIEDLGTLFSHNSYFYRPCRYHIASLNSGSNANCYYIGNKNEAVLIDAGLSCRETEKRMKRLGLDIKSVKAIFISHEHADHIAGLPGIIKKIQVAGLYHPNHIAKLRI